MQIPTHVSNYSIFKDGRRLIGIADCTLPNLQNTTDELKGSGIFGTIEMPVQSHFQTMSLTLNWHAITDFFVLATIQNGAQLHAWVAQQTHDSSTGLIGHEGWRFIFGVVPKAFNLGKLDAGTKGEAVSEYEVLNYRIMKGDSPVVEVDKLNAICRWFDGVTLEDTARDIRQFIGL